MYNVMIVDDEECILKAMERIFRFCSDLNIEYFQSPEQALRRSRVFVFDVIMSDYRMPEMNGLDFLIATKEFQPDAMRIILSAHVDAGSLMQAINQVGIDKYLTKPWDNEELIETIYSACKRRTTIVENRMLSDMVRDHTPEPFHYTKREPVKNKSAV